MAGLVRELQLKTTKKGDRFAIFRLEDQTGAVKCVLWPEPYRRNSSILADEATILVNGRAEISDEGMITIIAGEDHRTDAGCSAEGPRVDHSVGRTLRTRAAQCEEVKKLLEQSPGDCDVFIDMRLDEMTVQDSRSSFSEGAGQRRD